MMRALAAATVLLLVATAFWSAITVADPVRPLAGGWGIDACLSVHVPPTQVGGYLELLRGSHLRWLRERDLGPATGREAPREQRLRVWRQSKAAGYRILAFATLPDGLQPEDPDNVLPEDLAAVFEESFRLARMAGSDVDAWEMNNEPETSYLRDLPDRAVAYQKAVYLGLKAGGAPRPVNVLMGALALPPGPWLERASRNGLYDYTDGVNFHFYGRASDLTGVTAAQRKFARVHARGRTLPLWITECGMDATPDRDPDEPHGRELQRRFIVESAEIARAQAAAVFMPFILVHRGDNYALTQSPEKVYPAWSAYQKFTSEESLPESPAFSPPETVSPIVLQWLPDNSTCTPDKVGGVYWFAGGRRALASMKGEIVAYNFSRGPVSGNLDAKTDSGIRLSSLQGGESLARFLQIPAGSHVRIPVQLRALTDSWVRAEVKVGFQEFGASLPSQLMFAVGTRPEDAILPREFSIRGRSPGENFAWIWAPEPFRATSVAGPWLGLNGVIVSAAEAENFDALGEAWRFQIPPPSDDPRLPPMAVTKVDGLPEEPDGFLRLRIADEKAAGEVSIRVDLIDAQGQRFTIAENSGQNWIDPIADEVFLSYRDFHLYIWGRCMGQSVFRPGDIREIQLRFYSGAAVSADVRLDAVAPGEGGRP